MKVLTFMDYAGHINVYDISTKDIAQQIFTDIFNHYGCLNDEAKKAINDLNYNELEYMIEGTGGSFGPLRDYIIDIQDEWHSGDYD